MKFLKLHRLARVFIFAAACMQQPSQSAPRKAPFEKPKLVLVIVVDQFRYSSLTRFRGLPITAASRGF